MAMLASQSKGGYYPTPLKELSFIRSKLQVSAGDKINLLDPCCGTGEALLDLSEAFKQHGANLVTYGVELEADRAMEAYMALDNVIHDGYEQIRTEAKFSLLYLNPPYDDGFSVRNLTGRIRNVLQDNGVLVFVVPIKTIGNAAGILSARFTDFKVFRFSDANFDQFDQVALFARFKRLPEHEKKTNEKWLKDLAAQPKEALMPLDAEDDTLYELYSSEDIDVFRGSPMNVKELAKDLAESAVFEATQEAFENRAFAVEYQNPILELKPMHYGIAVSSNVVSGNMGNHMLVGGTRKVVNKKETKDEEGEVDDAGELIKEVMAIGVNIGFRKEK